MTDHGKLGELKQAFARCRAGKRRRGEPLPERLWARAVEAALVHGTTRTAKTLGLNHSALKRRIERRPQPKPEFLELAPGLLRLPAATLEIEDVSGARLRLALPGASSAEAAAAARELWSVRR